MEGIPFIQANDVEHLLDWQGACAALVDGHKLARASIADTLLSEGRNSLLNRAAWIRGLGAGVKTACIFPANARRTPPVPSVNAIFSLFDEDTGVPLALIDGDMLTNWKTAADSVVGARYLARADSRRLLIVGAGVVAGTMVQAYLAMFPGLRQVSIWNRHPERAAELAASLDREEIGIAVARDLPSAASEADIISSATLATEPVLHGSWIEPGTHVDLIGSYREDMREADDELIRKAELFVDSRDTAIRGTGELAIPIGEGIITADDVRADLYDLGAGARGRSSPDAVTLFKNGGGAHLDLMTAGYVFRAWRSHRKG